MGPIEIGALVFPCTDQLGFTGPFEVLSRIPGAGFTVLVVPGGWGRAQSAQAQYVSSICAGAPIFICSNTTARYRAMSTWWWTANT
jgi:putative intracellular protease/amidase